MIKEIVLPEEPHSIAKLLPKEEDLPSVSVITLTRDRRAFFPLAKYCMVAQSYPEDKIEWVVVDDGTDQIKDLISELPNVKYVLIDEPLSIGAKRNLAVQSASHDILLMMDDDDVYPNNSILSRVANMLAARKQCLFSTVIPCYQIHEHKSFMNVPPIMLPQSERVSEATLCFTRKFWELRKFPDQQIGEGDAFIRGREQMCLEFSPQDVIVSLIHKKNTSARKPPVMESNGCHYGFSDELFTLVSEIAERI
jgi:glycosyltransferase involved in cell wall biosynthesis